MLDVITANIYHPNATLEFNGVRIKLHQSVAAQTVQVSRIYFIGGFGLEMKFVDNNNK